jgi:hypothetical protein
VKNKSNIKMKLNNYLLPLLLIFVFSVKTRGYYITENEVLKTKTVNAVVPTVSITTKRVCNFMQKNKEKVRKRCVDATKGNGFLVLNSLLPDCRDYYVCFSGEKPLTSTSTNPDDYSQCITIYGNIFCSVAFQETNIDINQYTFLEYVEKVHKLFGSYYLPYKKFSDNDETTNQIQITTSKALPWNDKTTLTVPITSAKLINPSTITKLYTRTYATKKICGLDEKTKLRLREYCIRSNGFLIINSFLPNCNNYHVCFGLATDEVKDETNCIEIYGRKYCSVVFEYTDIDCEDCSFLEYVKKVENLFGSDFFKYKTISNTN